MPTTAARIRQLIDGAEHGTQKREGLEALLREQLAKTAREAMGGGGSSGKGRSDRDEDDEDDEGGGGDDGGDGGAADRLQRRGERSVEKAGGSVTGGGRG